MTDTWKRSISIMKTSGKLLVLITIVLTCGCAHMQSERSVKDVYKESKLKIDMEKIRDAQDGLHKKTGLGYVTPYVPIVSAPKTIKVWIPDYISKKNPNVLVSGHWIFMLLTPGGWELQKEEGSQRPKALIPKKIDLSGMGEKK